MEILQEAVNSICGLDSVVVAAARQRADNLIKPMGSMGKLEDYYVQLCGITGELFPELSKRAIVVMCGDHGIVEEGVATGLTEVTLIQARNFVRGCTGVCALAKQANARIVPVDVGIAADYDEPGIRDEKIRYGTANFTKGPAMTRDEAIQSIEAGIRVAWELIDEGYQILGTGEMGIGNTSPSSAILSVLSGVDPEMVTGSGSNLPTEKMAHKVEVIRQGISVNRPDAEDIIDVLTKVGGLEIGGMAGVMLGAASRKKPVLIDGFISTVSALVAVRLAPEALNYMIPSHQSQEKGAALASRMLGFEPPLDLSMRLGEGTGAALMFHILESAIYMGREMITCGEGGIAVV